MDIFKNEYALDHIGIAVNSIEEGQALYLALGFEQMHVEEVPTEKVKVGMYGLKNEVQIELLQPTSEDSPIQKFLDKKGPGIHHYCLRVDDIDAAVAKMKSKGVKLINEEPRPGAHNTRVVFVHPKSAGGVLVELAQPAT